MIQVGKNGGHDVAVYYNRKKGEFLTKVVERSRDGSNGFDFPRSIALSSEADPVGSAIALNSLAN